VAQHVVVFWPKELEAVLNGTKIVDARLSRARISPFGAVSHGDELLLKQPGRPIVGKVLVDNVLYFENLDGEALGKLRKEYAKDLGVDEAFWKQKVDARFATIIFLKRPQRFVAPMKSPKRDRSAWMVLNN
jgi:hypothetical protein